MHSVIINGYQLLCDAHAVLEPNRGTAALFLFYSLLSFSTFSFYMFVTLTFFFLGASLVCVNYLKRTADLVLWFPDKTAVSKHPWCLYNLILLKVSLNPNPTKLKLISFNVSISREYRVIERLDSRFLWNHQVAQYMDCWKLRYTICKWLKCLHGSEAVNFCLVVDIPGTLWVLLIF